MNELIGKRVEVRTFETVYRGVLIEIGETEIHLQSEAGWIIVPVDKVVEIKEVMKA